MKPTILPPIPNLSLAVGRQHHLVLSHLLQSPRYENFYITESWNGAYIILDNSAHEKKHGESPEILLQQAEEIRASEIVCPDHLFDRADTVRRTREALQFFLVNEARLRQMTPIPRLMLVPQGSSPAEFSSCLQELVLEFLAIQKKSGESSTFFPTIGVSKDYEMWEGGLHHLLRHVIFPVAATLSDPEIHLLGWGRDLWALESIVEDFGDLIRSIDSAKPIVYGIAGLRLDPNVPAPEYPRRSKIYFTTSISSENLEIVRENIKVFDTIVSGGASDTQLRTLPKMSTQGLPSSP